MGYDIHITARHRLNTDSLEALAQDLSKALDINIEYGYEHDYDVKCKHREAHNTVRQGQEMGLIRKYCTRAK